MKKKLNYLWYSITVAFVFFTGYLFIPHLHDIEDAVDLGLGFEKHIPYVPFMALFYLAGYIVILAPAFFFHEYDLFKKGAQCLLTNMFIAYIFFIFFPVRVTPVQPVGFFDHLLPYRGIFFDKGWNAFPSLHVAMATSSLLSVMQVSRPVSFASIFCWSGIFLSTILLKKHYLLDALAGIILGFFTFRFIVWPEMKRKGLSFVI